MHKYSVIAETYRNILLSFPSVFVSNRTFSIVGHFLKNNKAIKRIPVSDGFHTLFGVRVTEQEYRTSYRIYKNFQTAEKYTNRKKSFRKKKDSNNYTVHSPSALFIKLGKV
jgi:hypothetical protein